MHKSIWNVVLVVTGLCCLAVPGVMAFDFSSVEKSITEHTLENGLKIIIMERHEAPVATFLTWANVGSADDPKGYTGMAHMFEHMAFKGTTTLGSKDIDKELVLIAVEDSIFMLLRSERSKGRLADSTKLARLEEEYESAREASYEYVDPNKFGNVVDREGGVGLNAFTSRDATVYFFSLPSNRAELWMALESERFLKPVLREMYKERDVVAEERRMRYESNPIGKLVEDWITLAYRAHPYGNPDIGHMSDIQYYSRLEAKAFFQKYYSPSNLVICIVGDVQPDSIISLAERYWGEIPYRPAPPPIATVEPEQHGERRTVIIDASQPFWIAGWHVPDVNHPDRPAIDALIDYVGLGRTSLLYKSLVKEKKAAIEVSAFVGYPGDKYASLVAIYAMPSAGHTNEECEEAILAAVEKVKNELIPVEEIKKIKARAKASFINGLASNTGMAMQLAGTQTLAGDWRKLFKTLDRINAITADDIQRVAKKYLTAKNRTVAMLQTLEG